MIARSQFAIIISTAAGLSFLLPAHAAEPDNQFIIQQQRQKALEQQLTPPVPDVRLSEPSSSFGKIAFPVETPCFPIRNVTLTGRTRFPAGYRCSELPTRRRAVVWAEKASTCS